MRSILLLGHTHHDVGYTNSPRIIDRMHARIVAEVLDLIDADPATGPDAMRWTFEVSRPVLNFMKTADAADTARLKAAVDAGRVSVTGGYLNMTQLLSEQEFEASYEELARIRAAGIPIRTEQHGDVNGTAWGSVGAMRRAGIDRLVMALNPDHGRPPFEQPTGFWWEGQDGDRVFVWLSTHYGFGEEWGIVDGDVELAERNILAFIERLEARENYPYDTALVHAGNDNRWPTALFTEVVRHWNARHPELPMRTATIDEALDILEAQAGDAPVARGEWSDWWSHGHGSTAREVAVYREARSFALSAQGSLALASLRSDGRPALATVLGYRRGPVRLRDDAEVVTDLAEVDEQLLLFSEHTWGSWESYSKAHSIFSHSHWNAKAGFAYAAYDHARDLAIEGAYRLVASGADAADRSIGEESSVLLVNPTERERTEPVTVEVKAPHNRVRLASTVATVPAFGTAVIPVPPVPVELGEGTVIETAFYRAEVDPAKGGVVSLVDVRTGRELLDTSAPYGLGSVIVDQVPDDSTHPMVTTDPKAFHPDNPGPEFDRSIAAGTAAPRLSESPDWIQVQWETTGPTVPSAVATLRLYRESNLIDFDVYIAKPEVFAPESIFVAFPFAVDDPEFLLETAGAVYAAEREQLPDTSKDWYSIQHAIGVRGASDGILWGAFDAPLVQVGGIHTGAWARTLDAPSGHVYSWLANNLHFTNFQARQEATGRYRYRFAPHAHVNHDDVRVFGRDLLQPFFARQYEGPVRLDGPAGLHVEPADRVFAELRPGADGSVRLRLRNPSAEPVTATVTWDGGSVSVSTPSVELAPYAVADVSLDRP